MTHRLVFMGSPDFALPSLRALAYSLQKWDGLSVPKWVGLKNFLDLAAQWNAARRT